ncbi:MAG: hypothetical protein WBO82_03220 [Neisseria sp.]|mgnify:FL=1
MNKKLFKQLSRRSPEDNLNNIYKQINQGDSVLVWCVNSQKSRLLQPILYIALGISVVLFIGMLSMALDSWFACMCYIVLVSTFGLPVVGMFIWYLARMLLVDCCKLDTEMGKLSIYRNGRLHREFDLREQDVVSYSYTPPNRGGHTKTSWHFELALIRQCEGMFSLLRYQHPQPVREWLSKSYDEFHEKEHEVDLRVSALQQFLRNRCGLRIC